MQARKFDRLPDPRPTLKNPPPLWTPEPTTALALGPAPTSNWRIAALAAGIVTVLFAVWEIFDHLFLLHELDKFVLHRIYLVRGIVGASLTTFWALVILSRQRERAEDHLRTSRDFLDNILTSTVDAIITIDANNIVQTWNKGAEQIFGYPASEMVGRNLDRILPSDLREAAEADWIADQVREHGFLRSFETRRVRSDGRQLVVEITATNLTDPQGRYIGRSAIIRDITQTKALQAQLIRSERLAAVGEMAAAIAHEVKNPLAGIGGAMTIIKESFPKDDPKRQITDEILLQIRRLDDVVKDLLQFSKPQNPVKHPVELRPYLSQILEVLCESPALEDVTIDLEEVPGQFEVQVDESMMREVFWNLILNAAQATGSGGIIGVRARREGDDDVIEIQDDGPGIPPDRRAQIFRPFYTTKAKGTGLGLPICKKIVESHNGKLDVSCPLDGGTVFRIYLPRPQ
ncbi:MAG: ATP-binding protein [Planctomycetota bacterium]